MHTMKFSDTVNFWQHAQEKPTRGKPVRREYFYFFSKMEQQVQQKIKLIYTALNAPRTSSKAVPKCLLDFCAKN